MFCEQCNRNTDFLFTGIVTVKATKYEKTRGRVKLIGTVDIERDGMVCFRCRPPSNLEIQELLERWRTPNEKSLAPMLGLGKKRVRNNSLPSTAVEIRSK